MGRKETIMVTRITFEEQGNVWHGTLFERRDLFHLDYTYNAEYIGELGNGQSNSQTYFVIGENHEGNWVARTGETGDTFLSRWNASHRNADWYKMLNQKTVIYVTIYNTSKETLSWSTDFRLSLEESFTRRFNEEGFMAVNATRKSEKVDKTLNERDRNEVSEIVEDFMQVLPRITRWYQGQHSNTIVHCEKENSVVEKKKPKIIFSEGDIYYEELTWGVKGSRKTSKVEGIYSNGKMVLLNIYNAPYLKDWSKSGLDPAHFNPNLRGLYETVQKNSKPNVKGGYDWDGELVTNSVTNGLHLIGGQTRPNSWKKL
jgi:hypothetical protein